MLAAEQLTCGNTVLCSTLMERNIVEVLNQFESDYYNLRMSETDYHARPIT